MKSSLLLLLALVGGAHAIPTMLKEDAAEATRRRATDAGGQHGMPAAPVINHRILAVAGSGSGSGSGSAGPKPDDFDPKSPLTSYIDHRACGPRGDDAKADTSACPDGRAMVIKKQRWGSAQEVVHTDVDGCEYFAYAIYECELKAEIRPADASGSGSGSGSGSAGPKPDDFDPKSPLTSSLPLPGRSLSLPSPTPPSSPDHGTRQHSCVHINN